jgi:HD-like signal output (HDOD) protein
MTADLKHAVAAKLAGLQRMPSIPAILYPLLRYLEQPPEKVKIQQIVDLISEDESLAAQCLHMANSPLFGRWQEVDTVRGAVVALGIRRMQDIALSCTVLKIMPAGEGSVDPVVFWEHSLGCALLCRHFAKNVGFSNPDKAYLAGLLHDLGLIVNLWVLPKEFHSAMQLAHNQRIPIYEAEFKTFGMTHCDSGAILAERWKFGEDVAEVMRCHHDVEKAGKHRGLTAVVNLCDLLCRMRGLGHGFDEEREIDILQEPAFALLLADCPALAKFDWARFTFELEGYMEEVRQLVATVYRVHA